MGLDAFVNFCFLRRIRNLSGYEAVHFARITRFVRIRQSNESMAMRQTTHLKRKILKTQSKNNAYLKFDHVVPTCRLAEVATFDLLDKPVYFLFEHPYDDVGSFVSGLHG